MKDCNLSLTGRSRSVAKLHRERRAVVGGERRCGDAPVLLPPVLVLARLVETRVECETRHGDAPPERHGDRLTAAITVHAPGSRGIGVEHRLGRVLRRATLGVDAPLRAGRSSDAGAAGHVFLAGGKPRCCRADDGRRSSLRRSWFAGSVAWRGRPRRLAGGSRRCCRCRIGRIRRQRVQREGNQPSEHDRRDDHDGSHRNATVGAVTRDAWVSIVGRPQRSVRCQPGQHLLIRGRRPMRRRGRHRRRVDARRVAGHGRRDDARRVTATGGGSTRVGSAGLADNGAPQDVQNRRPATRRVPQFVQKFIIGPETSGSSPVPAPETVLRPGERADRATGAAAVRDRRRGRRRRRPRGASEGTRPQPRVPRIR